MRINNSQFVTNSENSETKEKTNKYYVVNGTEDYLWNISRTNGDLTIKNLDVTGNDFACLDSNGKLYRSATACA